MTGTAAPRPTDAEVAAILTAYRIVIAVADRSTSPRLLDPAQVRALASAAQLSSTHAPAAGAADAGSASTAQLSLLARGLLRVDAGTYRPTDEGLERLADVLDRRAEALDAILARLPTGRRIEITATLSAFAALHSAGQVTATAAVPTTSPARVSPRPPG